jgi:hypothetical protein
MSAAQKNLNAIHKLILDFNISLADMPHQTLHVHEKPSTPTQLPPAYLCDVTLCIHHQISQKRVSKSEYEAAESVTEISLL